MAADTEPTSIASPGRVRSDLPAGKTVGAVVNAVTILRYLASSPVSVGVTRIARETRINPSTCFNILRTLVAEDLVHMDPSSKNYSVSLGIMDIARGASLVSADIGSVRPLMERIAREHGVTLSLWTTMGADRKVLILSYMSPNAIRIQMTLGQRLPLLHGATGRCFAAFSRMDRDDIRRRFEAIRWDRPISFETFMEQVDEARVKGWALDQGHFAEGTVMLGVPVLDYDNIAIMGVTATMIAGQFPDLNQQALASDMQAFALQVRRIVVGAG